jgi:hypothetical protein
VPYVPMWCRKSQTFKSQIPVPPMKFGSLLFFDFLNSMCPMWWRKSQTFKSQIPVPPLEFGFLLFFDFLNSMCSYVPMWCRKSQTFKSQIPVPPMKFGSLLFFDFFNLCGAENPKLSNPKSQYLHWNLDFYCFLISSIYVLRKIICDISVIGGNRTI